MPPELADGRVGGAAAVAAAAAATVVRQGTVAAGGGAAAATGSRNSTLALAGMLSRRRFLGGVALIVFDATSSLILEPRKSSMRPEAPSRSIDEAVMTLRVGDERGDHSPCVDVVGSSCNHRYTGVYS